MEERADSVIGRYTAALKEMKVRRGRVSPSQIPVKHGLPTAPYNALLGAAVNLDPLKDYGVRTRIFRDHFDVYADDNMVRAIAAMHLADDPVDEDAGRRWIEQSAQLCQSFDQTEVLALREVMYAA